ncbi:MAG: magnesium transporter [Allobaculum sp.]
MEDSKDKHEIPEDPDSVNSEESAEEEVIHSRPNYENEILELVRSVNSPKLLREKLDEYHANDIAEAFHSLTVFEREKLYKMLDTEQLAEIIEYMDDQDQAKFLNEMNIRKVIAIFNEMETDKAADLLKGFDKEKCEIILELLEPEVRKKISVIFSYDEDEIGSKMTTNYIEVAKGLTVREAMRSLISQAPENDNITTIYVRDENGMYYGAVNLKDLIIEKADTPLEEIIVTSYPYVYANEPIDKVVEELKDYNEDSIPILNNDNLLLGVITSQDLLEVMDEEMGEDYAKLAGLAGEEDLEESLFQSLKKRLPWLIILLFLGLLVSVVVSLFEGVVAQLTIIMAFQSLILGMSGNAGTQSLAVTIRVLMDESLDRKQKLSLIWKELKVGFTNGLIIGLVSCAVLGVYIHFFKGYMWDQAYAISACIGIALWVSMIISSLTGTTIPLFFKKIGVDPAVASGPLITTVNDMVGVITYYGLAWLLLIEILHIG